MMKSIKTISLGCKVNTYENAAIKNQFLANGYVISEDNPSVVIINTCSVTATADQKSRQHIRKIKKDFPNSVIAVMGCYAQGFHDFLFNELGVPIVVGTSKRNKIYEYVSLFIEKGIKTHDVNSNTRSFDKYEELGTTPYFENVRAFLKIQDGCNNFCSYCLIPYVRGKARSRNKDSIIEEAKNIISNGYHEIVLAGIHVGGYGLDFNDGYKFSDLIDDLTNLNGLDRLTISSIEASEIDDKLINLLKERKNIARHLHIPLQAGSSSILKAMNRKYTKEEFLNKIKKIRENVPDIMIATDIITGFPGETNEDFIEGFNVIKECGFNKLHVFPFSAREGTLAFKMKNQIDPSVKKEKCKKLIELSDSLYDAYLKKNDGNTLNVLVESYDSNTKMVKGLSENYIECEFSGSQSDINSLKTIKYSYKK